MQWLRDVAARWGAAGDGAASGGDADRSTGRAAMGVVVGRAACNGDGAADGGAFAVNGWRSNGARHVVAWSVMYVREYENNI